jgi:hypothetical protein
MAFFVEFTEFTSGPDPRRLLINLEQVTRCMEGAKNGGTIMHLTDGKEVVVSEDFAAVTSQCSVASRRS